MQDDGGQQLATERDGVAEGEEGLKVVSIESKLRLWKDRNGYVRKSKWTECLGYIIIIIIIIIIIVVI